MRLLPHVSLLSLVASPLIALGQGAPPPLLTPAGTLLTSGGPVPSGKAPAMQVRQLKATPEEQVWVVVLHSGDEAMSGLTDFALAHHVQDAHFTAIGATNAAVLAWLDPTLKKYRALPVTGQHEVLSLLGDIAMYNGKPAVHMHTVLGDSEGRATGGHVFQLYVYPTLELYVTVNTTPIQKQKEAESQQILLAPEE